MFRKWIFPASLLAMCCVSCRKKESNAPPGNTGGGVQVSVLTQHNDNTRSGWNSHETILNQSNVNVNHFGKLFDLQVDDQVYAQPLVLSGLSIAGKTCNVLFAATVNNSVYAYDGDNGKLYWQKNYTEASMRPPRNSDMTGACGGSYFDFSGNLGIVGTPVIDSTTSTLYFVARSTNGHQYVQYLHAVEAATGNERPGSPVRIWASLPGNGAGNVGGIVSFDPQRANQRQALTLNKGIVYVSFSSHCDWGPYHGWILGYRASDLGQVIVYNDTPDGDNGGFWESGMGLAADDQGALYAVSGNGTVGLAGDPMNMRNRGESALKLVPAGNTLQVASYFTPYNYQDLENNDLDYGGMGSMILQGTNLFLTGCKDGHLYLLDKDNMGGLSASANQVQQSIFLSNQANMHCQPAYFGGGKGEFVYVWPENEPLRAIPFVRGANTFDAGKIMQSFVGGPTGQNGAMLSVSSNGSSDSTGILWAAYASSGDAEHSTCPGILRAFDAGNISRQLWNSNENAGRDDAGNYAKFAPPCIANGHVYLATFSNRIVVYGLLH